MKLENPLDIEILAADDVLLLPKRGVLPSRDKAQVDPFIFSAPMDKVTGYEMVKAMLEQGQFAVVSRFISEQDIRRCLVDFGRHPNVFFAIGIGGGAKPILDLIGEVSVEEEWPADSQINLAIDVAHGDMQAAHDTAKFLRGLSSVRHLMSGSICTPDAAMRAIDSGCDHLRVGVGPGGACTTRLMTGCGMPQLSAVYLIWKWVHMNCLEPDKVKIIADGGIRQPKDANKYLAAGADYVMMGSLLSRTYESEGWRLVRDERFMEEVAAAAARGECLPMPLPDPPLVRMKMFRGQASASFQIDHYDEPNDCPEGACSEPFYWDGETTVETVVKYFYGGLKSAISYLGLISSNQMSPENCDFIKITHAAYAEGLPHGI